MSSNWNALLALTMAAAFAFASASIAWAYHTPREPPSCQIACDGRLQKWCQGSGSQMHCWCVCYPRSSSNTGYRPFNSPPPYSQPSSIEWGAATMTGSGKS
jgi:hypothetical protein